MMKSFCQGNLKTPVETRNWILDRSTVDTFSGALEVQ
jgi:hypothetical protein